MSPSRFTPDLDGELSAAVEKCTSGSTNWGAVLESMPGHGFTRKQLRDRYNCYLSGGERRPITADEKEYIFSNHFATGGKAFPLTVLAKKLGLCYRNVKHMVAAHMDMMKFDEPVVGQKRAPSDSPDEQELMSMDINTLRRRVRVKGMEYVQGANKAAIVQLLMRESEGAAPPPQPEELSPPLLQKSPPLENQSD